MIRRNSKIEGSSGLEEMQRIFSMLHEAKKKPGKRKFRAPIGAVENKCVWVSQNDPTIRLTSLSPSDYSIFQSKRELAELIPKVKEPKSWLIPRIPNANHVAVVLWFECAGFNLLLGSDIESDANHDKGWTAIVNSNRRPAGNADIYKVSHHGSINGDSPRLWKEMLTAAPYAVCTPYNRGTTLPSPEDVKRICNYTKNAYITSTRKVNESLVKKENAVQRTIDEAGIKFHGREYLPGMIRLRKKVGDKNNICSLETFHGAAHLKEFK